jgi:hypothetical protein
MVNEIATSFLQTFVNQQGQTVSVEPVQAEWTPLAPIEVDVT